MITLNTTLPDHPRFGLDVQDNLSACDGFTLLAECRPTGNWSLDNQIGKRLICEAIALDLQKRNQGYFTQELLQELSLTGIDWRGIQVGIFTELAEIVVKRRR